MNPSTDGGPPLPGTAFPQTGTNPPTVPVDLGPSLAARSLREQLSRASAGSRVLVIGPPGSGHAAAAAAIHAQSPRAAAPWINVPPDGQGLSRSLEESARTGGTLVVARVELLGREDQVRLLTAI